MDQHAQLVYIIICCLCVLTIILYYLNYVSIYSYIVVFLVMTILILIILINLYRGRGVSCIEQRNNKPKNLNKLIQNNVLKYLNN